MALSEEIRNFRPSFYLISIDPKSTLNRSRAVGYPRYSIDQPPPAEQARLKLSIIYESHLTPMTRHGPIATFSTHLPMKPHPYAPMTRPTIALCQDHQESQPKPSACSPQCFYHSSLSSSSGSRWATHPSQQDPTLISSPPIKPRSPTSKTPKPEAKCSSPWSTSKTPHA